MTMTVRPDPDFLKLDTRLGVYEFFFSGHQFFQQRRRLPPYFFSPQALCPTDGVA